MIPRADIINAAVFIYGVGGGIFKWFPWELVYIAEVAVILVIALVVTNVIMVWQNNEVAKAINKKIKERNQ